MGKMAGTGIMDDPPELSTSLVIFESREMAQETQFLAPPKFDQRSGLVLVGSVSPSVVPLVGVLPIGRQTLLQYWTLG